MILDAFTISWFLSHPDHLLLFLKGETRRAKEFHGKKTAVRRAWRAAKRETLALVRLLNQLEDMTDEAEIYGMSERVVDDVRSSGSYAAVNDQATEARARVEETFQHALVLEENANQQKSWFTRSLRENAVRGRAHSLVISEVGTPWQQAWMRAKGFMF
jgi:hypothetical protein